MKRLLVFLLVFLCPLAWAGYYFAASSSGTGATNGYVVVGVGNWTSSTNRTVTALTFDGTSMGANLTTDGHGSNTSNVATLFGLAIGNKAAGTYTVSGTMSGAATEIAVVVAVFNGVHQTVSTGTAAHTTGTSTTPSLNVTAATNDLVIDLLTHDDGTVTVGAGQTIVVDQTDGGSSKDASMSSEAGATTTTMSYTISSQSFALLGVALKPSGGSAPTVLVTNKVQDLDGGTTFTLTITIP